MRLVPNGDGAMDSTRSSRFYCQYGRGGGYAERMIAVPVPSRFCFGRRVVLPNVPSGERARSIMIWVSRPQSLWSV
jgi:hypothetical protein